VQEVFVSHAIEPGRRERRDAQRAVVSADPISMAMW
jgi:hypothetical protein